MNNADTIRRAEDLAQFFHETYERLAPSFGYETRKASAVPWEDVPENNKALMVAVCAEVMDALLAENQRLRDALEETLRVYVAQGQPAAIEMQKIARRALAAVRVEDE